MNRSRRLLVAALVPLALAAPASAVAASFGPAQPLALPVKGPLAAAVGPGGNAIVAGALGGTPAQARVEVATRAAAGAPWSVAGYATNAAEIRDLQVAIGGRETVVAWAEARRHGQSVVVATAGAGAHLTVRERVPVADAFAAYPRLAVLRSGAVVVAWRDATAHRSRAQARVATLAGDHFAGAPRTAGVGAAQIVLTAAGGGAAIGWINPFQPIVRTPGSNVGRAGARTLTVRRLDGGGRLTGAPSKVGSDVGTVARLAGSPDGRVVASWLRPQKIRPFPGERNGDPIPPSAFVAPVAFTRQVLPSALPARPLSAPGGIAGGVPIVAFDAPGHAVAALRGSTPAASGPAFDALLAGSDAGGPWTIPALVAPLGFSRFDPVVAALASGGPVVVYTALVPAAGTPSWTVGVTDATGAHALGTTTGGDGRVVAVAHAGDRMLVAWPTDSGVRVSDRG